MQPCIENTSRPKYFNLNLAIAPIRNIAKDQLKLLLKENTKWQLPRWKTAHLAFYLLNNFVLLTPFHSTPLNILRHSHCNTGARPHFRPQIKHVVAWWVKHAPCGVQNITMGLFLPLSTLNLSSLSEDTRFEWILI